jgi:hypothetical protein
MTYKPVFSVRATRRQSLVNYGFVCQCEVCGLPDHVSDARDAKFKLADDAANFILEIVTGKKLLRGKTDARRALQCIQTYFSFITQERTFYPDDLMLPITFFAFLGLADPLRQVGEVLHPILTRYCGPGDAFSLAESLSRYLKDPRTHFRWGAHKTTGDHVSLAGFDDLIQRTVSSIISNLRDLV